MGNKLWEKYNKPRYHSDKKFRESCIEATKKWNLQYPYKSFANRTIQNHKRHGIKLEISSEELSILAEKTLKCSICGITLNYGPKGRHGWVRNSPSVDRIDGSKLVTKSNLQIICAQCNSAKNVMSLEEFIEYCKRVVASFPLYRKL